MSNYKIQGANNRFGSCNKSLEVVETKYRTLKGWAEKDKEWRLRFLIIDRCYSDTAYYRDDIIAIQNHIKGNNQKK